MTGGTVDAWAALASPRSPAARASVPAVARIRLANMISFPKDYRSLVAPHSRLSFGRPWPITRPAGVAKIDTVIGHGEDGRVDSVVCHNGRIATIEISCGTRRARCFRRAHRRVVAAAKHGVEQSRHGAVGVDRVGSARGDQPDDGQDGDRASDGQGDPPRGGQDLLRLEVRRLRGLVLLCWVIGLVRRRVNGLLMARAPSGPAAQALVLSRSYLGRANIHPCDRRMADSYQIIGN